MRPPRSKQTFTDSELKATYDKVQDFIKKTGAKDTADRLAEELRSKNGGKMPHYSDLVHKDDEHLQYVNFIQEGGGVLGVALVGYTYVLEKLGIRFVKLAGTSAGAINTLMLASVDPVNYKYSDGTSLGYTTQSEAVMHEMLSYNLWHLVDGNWFAKAGIITFLKKNDLVGGNSSIMTRTIITLLILAVGSSLFTIPAIHAWASKYDYLVDFMNIIGITSISLIIIFVMLILFLSRKLALFARSNYGINPGRNFTQWMEDILARNGIHTTAELENAMRKKFDGQLKLRDTRPHVERDPSIHIDEFLDNRPDITGAVLKFVTSDIINQTKVEFPASARYYWKDHAMINPSLYVRASMAIPVFYEPLIVNISELLKDPLRRAELEEQELRLDVDKVLFVDGGTLSNFPINAFHNQHVKVARMPTFGVRLDNNKHIESGKISSDKMSFMDTIGTTFNTIRGFYDKEFILKNKIYRLGIGYIDVSKFSWLDFTIKDKVQMELFTQGIKAAEVFFKGGTIWDKGKKREFKAFDWDQYKSSREKVVDPHKDASHLPPSTETPTQDM